LIACAGLHKRNIDASSELFSDAEGDTKYYTNLPTVASKKLKIPLLKTFIHVCLFPIASIPRGQSSRILKNKGKLEKVEAGELPVKLPQSITEDNGNAVFDGDDVGEDAVNRDDVVNGEDGEDSAVVADNDAPPRLSVVSAPTVVTPSRPSTLTYLPSHYMLEQYFALVASSIHEVLRIK